MSLGREIDELLAKSMAGDRGALVRLLEACAPQVRAKVEPKISPTLRSSLDIDDVMQVTYLEAVLRLSSFRSGGVGGFIAWLTRMAENNLIDAVRSLESAKRPNPSKRVGANRTDESADDFIAMLGANTSTPSRHAAKGEAWRFLDAAISSLPPDYEKVVRLFDIEGKPITEVAAAIGRSEGATWMLRARAHDRLKEAMGPPDRFFSAAP